MDTRKFKEVHLLFEQSGTFKNEFIKLGFNAYDYDIVNTEDVDYHVDLFKEINAFDYRTTIFDNISSDDLVIAFFPCIRFSVQSIFFYQCTRDECKKMNLSEKIDYHLKYYNELDYYFRTLLKLLKIADLIGFKLVIENPYSEQSYLYRYAPIRPTIIDYDRRLNGDYFVKPTMYYFINFNPSSNLIFEPLDYIDYKRINDLPKGIERSLIHPQYVNRFIREYLLWKEKKLKLKVIF